MVGERVAAIYGGGDWYDASVDHVVVPEGFDFGAARSRHRAWYRDVYRKQPQFIPGAKNPGAVKYISFPDWLIKHEGARRATDVDVIDVWDE